MEGPANEGGDRRIVVAARHRIGIPLSIRVLASNEQGCAAAERRSDVGRYIEERIADPAAPRRVRLRTVDRALLMQGELARLELEVDRLRLVKAVDRLAADQQIVPGKGFLVPVLGAEVAPRHDANAAVPCVARGERDPSRHLLVPVETEIGGILVPGDIAAVAGILGPKRRCEEQNIGPDQVLDRVQDARVRREFHESGKAKMRFETQKLAEAAMRRLERFQLREDPCCRARFDSRQGTNVARLPEHLFLCVGQHLPILFFIWPSLQIPLPVQVPDGRSATGPHAHARASALFRRRKIAARGGVRIALGEEIERLRRLAGLDLGAGLAGDLHERTERFVAAGEAHALEALAERRQRGAGLAAAVEHGGRRHFREIRACGVDQRLEPERTAVTAGAPGARERHGHVERAGGGEGGAGVGERMDDDPLAAHTRGVAQASLPTTAAASTMRFEKPHSLSYHESTRQKRLPRTLVCVRSKVELAGLWLKSLETSSSLFTARMPRKRLEFAALSMSSLISASDVSRPAVKARSISDAFGVGTRIEVPSSLPLSAGITRPIALAAPVEVGIVDSEAARARRRSLWSVSMVG